MENLHTMTIIEMQEYARKKNIDIPINASKSEILTLIVPSHLSDLSMMEIKNRAYKYYIKIPTSKNKDELVANATDGYTLMYNRGNYEMILTESLNRFRKHKDYSVAGLTKDSYYKGYTDRDIDSLIKSVPHVSDMPSDNKYASTILSKPVYIKNYLLHLIHLETEVDFLKKYLSSLGEYSYHSGVNRQAVKNICDKYMNDKTTHEAYDLYGKLEMLKYMQQNPTKYISEQASIVDGDGVRIENPRYWKLIKPKAPKAPFAPRITKPIPPKTPQYGKPTLFNRKKVLEENEVIKKKYEAELSKYNAAFKKYQAEQNVYTKAMEEYKVKYSAYEEALREYNLKLDEQKKQIKIFDKAVSELGKEQSLKVIKKDIIDTEKEINAIAEKNKELSEELLESMLEEVLYKFLADETKKARKELKETLKTLREMYAYNVVYEKYRELPILTTLYEYINSGRCFDLRGGDGAYNLYESELRANIIFNKLDNIAMSLESIKANQLMLYTELKQVNENLEIANVRIKKVVDSVSHIDKTLVKVNSRLTSIDSSLESIDKSAQSTARNTAIAARSAEVTAHNSSVTAYNTQVTAYNSAITAQYSRISASRLGSIEFMMSFQ